MARKRLRIDGVFDIECHGWVEFLVGVTRTADRKIVVHESPDDMVDRMLSLGGTWWGHNAGKYDTLQVLEVLRRRGIGQSISLSRSRITRTMGGGLTIRDSYALVPMGLDVMSQIGKTLKPSLWFDCVCGDDCGGYCQLRKNMPLYMRERLKEYCIQDCDAHYEGLVGLQEFCDEHDIDLTGTLGGSAWATVQRRLEVPDADFSPYQWSRIRNAYYGGRTSVFRPIVTNGEGSHWDISSAYPAALCSAELPVGSFVERGSRSATNALHNDWPGIYCCTIRIPESEFPYLPYGMDNATAFPYGVLSGVWCLPELQYAEQHGATIESVEWGITWDTAAKVFDEFIPEMYALRVSVGKDTALGDWIRLFCNSIPGKFAENPEKQFLRMHPPLEDIVCCPAEGRCTLSSCSGICGAWEQLDKWGELWSVPFFKMPKNGHIIWAAYTTAMARIKHHGVLVNAGSDAVYCATDSLWTTSDTEPVGAGDGLGQLAHKGTFMSFESPAPNVYAFVDGKTGEYVVRASGAVVRVSDWTRGTAIQDRGILSITEAARAGHGLFSRAHRVWTLPPHGEWYGDRKLDVNGRTRAVTVEELRNRLYERKRRKRESNRGTG